MRPEILNNSPHLEAETRVSLIQRFSVVDIQDRYSILRASALLEHILGELIKIRGAVEQDRIGNNKYGWTVLIGYCIQPFLQIDISNRDASRMSSLVGVAADRYDVAVSASVVVEQAQAVIEIERRLVCRRLRELVVLVLDDRGRTQGFARFHYKVIRVGRRRRARR